MSNEAGDSATDADLADVSGGKNRKSQSNSKEKSVQVVESELSHPNIFDPDVEDKNRDLWHIGSFFTIVILTSGLWMKLMFRLPVVLLKTTGGAFITAFVCVLVLLCIPLASLETFTGQYGGKPFLLVMGEVFPIARGVGFAIVIDNFLEMILYGAQLSQLFVYCFTTFKSPVPWESCGAKYNSQKCTTDHLEDHCLKNKSATGFYNHQCVTANAACGAFQMSAANSSHCASGGKHVYLPHIDRPTAQEEYYEGPIRNCDNITLKTAHSLGDPSIALLGGLGAVWIIVMLCSIGGLKPLPFLACVVFILPLIGYLVFLIYSLTLDGASEGINHFFPFNKKSKNLLSGQCWADAAALAFSCMSVGYGTYSSLAAKNRTRRRSHCDVLLVGLVCFAITFITTLSFYGLIGSQAKAGNTTIEAQLKHNVDMARVLIPNELGRNGGGLLWSALFFFLMTIFGIGSMSLHMACVVSDISSTCEFKCHSVLTCVMILLFGLGMGSFFCFSGSIFVLDTIEDSILGSKKIILSLLLLIVVIFLYGPRNLIHHIRKRLKIRLMPPSFFWQLCWYVVCPLGLIALPALAVLGKGGTVFKKEIPTWIKLVALIYEFYYWIIIFVFLVQTSVAWKRPTKPRGVWRLEESPDDEDDSTKSETVLRTETLADIDSQSGLDKKDGPGGTKGGQSAGAPSEAGDGDNPPNEDEELPMLPGEKRDAERRAKAMDRIRGLEKEPAPDEKDIFGRLHSWSRGPPKPPTPPPEPPEPSEPPEASGPGDPAEPPASTGPPESTVPPESTEPAEPKEPSEHDESPKPPDPPTPPPTPPPLPPSPPPRPPSVDSIGTEYANFMGRQSPTMLARALPIPEQERVEAEGASRLPWRDAQVRSAFGPDLLGLMSPTARRGLVPGRGRVSVEPFGEAEDKPPSRPASSADVNASRSRSKGSMATALPGSRNSLVASIRSGSRHSLPASARSASGTSFASSKNVVVPAPDDGTADSPKDADEKTPSLMNMLRNMK